jgi:uncharacterized protein (TIGR02452 family)
MESRQKPFYDRILCWEDTKKYAMRLPIPPKSIKYVYVENVEYKKKYDKTIVSVENIDTLDCGLSLKSKGLNPLVLNLADPFMSGGCVDLGSCAQEESIFRRTNYNRTLLQTNELYPIEFNEAIYSPNVLVFKESEMNDWKIIDIPEGLSLIACTGIPYPRLEFDDIYQRNTDARYKSQDIDIMKLKIRHILQVAYRNSHDSLVLGALGCGAFKGAAKHTARLFKEIIAEFDGVFKEIVFAVLKCADDTKTETTSRDNYTVFKEIIE